MSTLTDDQHTDHGNSDRSLDLSDWWLEIAVAIAGVAVGLAVVLLVLG